MMGTKYVSMSLLYNNSPVQKNSEIPAEGKFIFMGWDLVDILFSI